MPCIVCKNVFPIIPCILNKNVVKEEIIIADEYIKELFNSFSYNCPCSECLVKMTCYTDFQNGICSKFTEFIDSHRDIYEKYRITYKTIINNSLE